MLNINANNDDKPPEGYQAPPLKGDDTNRPKFLKPLEDENKPKLGSNAIIDVKSYVRSSLNIVANTSEMYHSLRLEKFGLSRFETEEYEDLDYFISINDFKIIVCVTLSSEEPEEVNNTLDSVIVNIHTLSRKFGMTADDFLVVIMADGIVELHKDYKKLLFGDKNENIKEDISTDNEILEMDGHYFHMFIADYHNKLEEIPEEFCRFDLIFAVKEGNHGRKNLINNFFSGICHELITKSGKIEEIKLEDRIYSMIVDPGTVLHRHCMYKLLLTFDYHPSAGAVCGEMEVDTTLTTCKTLEASQYLENKFEIIYEKHFDNNFGMIIDTTASVYMYRVKSIFAIGYTNRTFFRDIVDNFTSATDSNGWEDNAKSLNLDLVGMQNETGIIKFCPDAKANYKGISELSSYLIHKRKLLASSIFRFFDILFPKELIRSEKASLHKVLLILYGIYWGAWNFGLKIFNLAMSYTFSFIVISFAFTKYPIATSWMMGWYALILFCFVIFSLSRNGPGTLNIPYHILIFCVIPFMYLSLGCFIASIVYLIGLTNAYMNWHSIVILSILAVFGTVFPIILHCKFLFPPLCFGVWSFSVYNTIHLNLIPIYTYANIDDHDVEKGCNDEDIRREKRGNYNMAKIKLFLLYILLNGVFMFIFCEGRFNDTVKLKYAEVFLHFYFWTFFIKALFCCFDKIRWNTKEKNERKNAKEKIKTFYTTSREAFLASRSSGYKREYKNKGFNHSIYIETQNFSEENLDEEINRLKNQEFDYVCGKDAYDNTKNIFKKILRPNDGDEINIANFAQIGHQKFDLHGMVNPNEDANLKYDSNNQNSQILIHLDESKLMLTQLF